MSATWWACLTVNFRPSNLGLFGFPLQAHARENKRKKKEKERERGRKTIWEELALDKERIGLRRRGRAGEEDNIPLRLPLFVRRQPVHGVLIRFCQWGASSFCFSHCAAFILSSNFKWERAEFFLLPLLALSFFSLILFPFRPSIIGLFGMLLQTHAPETS